MIDADLIRKTARKYNPQTAGLLMSCNIHKNSHDDELTLDFNTSFTANKFRLIEHREVLSKVLTELYNKTFDVSILAKNSPEYSITFTTDLIVEQPRVLPAYIQPSAHPNNEYARNKVKTIFLAGPMQERGDYDHNCRDRTEPADWRKEVMDRAQKYEYIYPEMVEDMMRRHNVWGSDIPKKDIDLIRKCDLLVAYVDGPDRIGTYCEIAAAYALGVRTHLVSFYPIPWFIGELLDSYDDVPYEYENGDYKWHIDKLVEACGGDYKRRINYQEYIQSPEWKEKATAAKERAGWRCQICNEKPSKKDLHAHHRTYERLGKEEPGDITVLCSKHHAMFHDKQNNNGSKDH